MQSQNVNLIKPNKSSLPPQINIYQLPELHIISPPGFSKQAAEPLNLTYEQVKMLLNKPPTNQPTFLPSNKPILPQKLSIPSPKNDMQTQRNQNIQLQEKLNEMTRLYQQQKFKYNELKNLYKEGQAMFQILEDKKITLQKQNKQLRLLLQNFYQQLHSENEHFYQGQDKDNKRKQQFINNKIPILSTTTTTPTNNHIQSTSNKIQKVKIGNKKIPVIKVNVPPQTFTKKEHSVSVFSQNSDFNSVEMNNQNINSKEEISSLKLQIQKLKAVNYQLQNKLEEVKQDLQKSKKLIEEYQRKLQNTKNPIVTFKQNIISPKNHEKNEKQHQNIFSPFSVDFKFSKIENQQYSQSFSQGQMSQYHHQDRQNVSYYKSKYNILETQVKKKDEALKNLYNQCYTLQAEINKIKTQSSPMQPTLPGSSRDTRQSWTQQKHLSHFNLNKQPKQQTCDQKMSESFQSKGEWFYQSKINQLQKRINELNQMCISNVNQTFRINELNDTINKLTRENNSYEQKIIDQEAQLSRLYKILENKNTQLSEIYTTITESKRNYALDESKKKSINNIFINTPEKNPQFSSQNLFYSKGYSKDQSFH